MSRHDKADPTPMATNPSATKIADPWRRALLWSLGLVLAGRLVALGFGLMLWETDQIPAEPDYTSLTELDPEPRMGSIEGWTVGLWQRHDTAHYLEIAEHGYDRRQEVIVFPPLYPVAIRAVGWIAGGDLLIAALIVSTVASWLALAVLFRLAEELFDRDIARWSTLYQLIFPTGYILLAAYAEPLMLLLTVSTFYLVRKDRWALAGLSIFLATLTRTQSVVLLVPVLIVLWRHHGRELWRNRGALVAIAAGPAGVAAFQIYLVAAGLPRSDQVYRDSWGSVPTIPGYEVWLAVQDFFGSTTIGRRLALILFLAAIGLTVLAFKKLPLEYGAYMAAMIVFILLRHDQTGRPLLSFSRHALMLFPGFMAMAATVRTRQSRVAIAYVSGAANLLLMTVFFMWGFSE